MNGIARPVEVDADSAAWFFENSLDLFMVVHDGAVEAANRAFWEHTGWRPEEVVGRPLWDFVHPDDQEILSARARELDGAGVGPTEHRLRKRDGDWLWVRGQAQRTQAGRYFGLLRDITQERARTIESAEARHSAELLRTAAGISVWRYKPDKNVFIYGLDVAKPDAQPGDGSEVRAKGDVQGAIHPDDAPLLNSAWKATLASGEVNVVEYRKREAGHDDWRRLRTAWRGVKKTAGGRWEVLGLTQDVTELAEARDAALQGEQAAQQAAEIKSQFLANMSHEIRTPMNGVLGVLHLLKSEALSDEGRGLLEEALACGSMLSELLNDVIDFSKIEAGKLELSPEPVDIVAALEGVAGMMRGQAQAKGLWLRTAAPPDAGWASLDPVRLRQMLFNLIGNAVKFTLTGGVEARLLLQGAGASQRLRIEIEDTGIGISPDVQCRLFERFHQADGSTTRRFGGSGLGLTICRKLAEMMGGEVGLDSTVGFGSTFWFEIAAPSVKPAAAVVEGEAAWLDGLQILVVDDNSTNRLIATKMLENLGASVSTAEHGGQAVEAAKTGAYDLIFMDIQMPVMDGVEATHAIRALSGPVGAIPIIAMTANAMSHQRQSYRDAGMDGSVSKPLSPSALMAELARVLDEGVLAASEEPFYLEA